MVLRQALTERIIPVMTINKRDRSFMELQLEPDEMYQSIQRIIENANVIMATYQDEKVGDVQVYPEKGTIAFSAGLHGWAFTLTRFAQIDERALAGASPSPPSVGASMAAPASAAAECKAAR
ncbi:hypothetical protein I4F81_009014 [Pyropia yezoensis]|uniref:Uncharacterized protein n=1 Tax=Pyropia yezoensis TaxID=2788 RepID=A0ACC3C9S0_PYRYE|nr:hypothetical protein I4F81_009014 [Neopyropia yezoensis]